MTKLEDCKECFGDGWVWDQIWRCGDPDIDFERCHACGGCGSLPIKDTTADTHNALRQEKPE